MATIVTINAAGIALIKDQASKLIGKILRDIHSRILDLMRQPKTGRVYYRGKKKSIKHQASAPGEAPAVDHSILWNSISAPPPAGTVGTISVGAEYGVFLEQGTRFMKRRPYIEPAVNGILTQLQQGGVISSFTPLETGLISGFSRLQPARGRFV